MSKKTTIRRDAIIKTLQLEKTVKIETLSQTYQVTKETIRTDLKYLEEKGLLHRTPGGAMIRTGDFDLPFEMKENELIYEKRQLARSAYDLIKDDSVIYIGPTSTASYLGILLKNRKNLTIVTNSFGILPYFKDCGHPIIVTGGEYSFSSQKTGGTLSTKIISCLHFDVCIMGMYGCKNSDGPCNIANDETLLHEEIIKRSETKILIADPSKFHNVGNFQFAKFTDIDYFITGKLTDEQRKQCQVKHIIEVNLKNDSSDKK